MTSHHHVKIFIYITRTCIIWQVIFWWNIELQWLVDYSHCYFIALLFFQIIVSIILQAKRPNILWFQLFKHYDLLLFFVICNSTLKIFRIWIVGEKQTVSWRHPRRLKEIMSAIFTVYKTLHFINSNNQQLNQWWK